MRSFLTMDHKKGFFKPGHQFSKGRGRPPGSVDSKRHLLTKLFLDQSEEYWPVICQTLFEEALNGNTKVLLFIAEYAMIKPSQTVICEPTEATATDLDSIKSMSSADLRSHAAHIINIQHKRDPL